MPENYWKSVAKVKRAKNRKTVFLAIEEPVMPSELVIKIFGKPSNTHFNIVSRALSELTKSNLVRIKNPKERTGRLYELTQKGKNVKKKLLT